LQSHSAPFVPIWHVTADKSAAKIAYPIDLLAAVLDGSIAASTQVCDDGSATWIAAGNHPRIAPLFACRTRAGGRHWLFVALSVLLFVPLLVSLLSSGHYGWTTLIGFGFLVMMLQEAYGAAVESIELTRGRQVLLYLGSVAASLIGFAACGALIELARLTLLPALPADSDWLAIPYFICGVLVLLAVSESLWTRWKPYGRPGRPASSPAHKLATRAAQTMAKASRIKGLLGVDGCRSRVWADGDRYAGKQKDGRQDGHGVFIWSSGERYEGEWRNGKRHGHGVSVKADGTETPGRWQDDRRVADA
jgi:MORN repeat